MDSDGEDAVASSRGRSRTDAAERERARLYEARRSFHLGVAARRRRDDLIAVIAGGLLILAVIGGQVAYYTVGPGAA